MQQVVGGTGDLLDQGIQLGVDLSQPAAVVDAVGHVLELVGGLQIGVVEHVALQDVRVQGGNAVDGLAGGHAQVGHADLAAPDDGHIGDLAGVIAVALLQLGLIAGSDLLQDDPDAGQQLGDQILGPALQSLSQDGVVGVAHGVGDDVPGVFPGVALLVHQDTHQLGDDQSGMGIVDLDGVLLVEVAQGAVLSAVLAHDGLHGGGDKEVLLLQTQGLALVVVVGGVDDLGDDLGHGLLLDGLQILTAAVQGHVHRSGALGVPQAQGVGVAGLVTGDLHVAGNGQNGGVTHVLGAVVAVLVPVIDDLAAEANLLGLVHLGDEPGIAQAHPVVGQLDLLAVDDLLLEQTQLIADGVAGGGDLLSGHGVQIAGSQTAQTAVAQTGVGLRLEQVAGGETHVLQSLAQGLQQTQVVGVLLQRTAHQELQGQVVDLTLLLFPDLIDGLHLVAGHDVTQNQSAGLEHMSVGGLFHSTAEITLELANDHFGELCFGVFSHDCASRKKFTT